MPPRDFQTYRDQIISDIMEKIADGRLAHGQKLPSTRELAEQYGVAQSTARSAIDRLLDRGVLRGHQGVGVFVV